MFAIRTVRRAFTIVELLVVIAIIGVLIALLLPAVQMARESGRRISCSNNLKQLGLAMHQYHELNKNFPINWGTLVDANGNSITGRNGMGQSWLTGVLPFIEEKPIYDMIKFGQPLYYKDPVVGNYPNLVAASQPVAEFACPSDPGARTLSTLEPLNTEDAGNQPALTTDQKQLGTTNYKACAGMNWYMSVDPKTEATSNTRIYALKGRNSGDPNAITVGGTAPPQPPTYELDHGNGISCRGCLKFKDSGGNTVTNPLFITSDRDIRDGLSKTFAIGESVPAWCVYSAWYSYEGATATCGIPVNYIANLKNRSNLGDMVTYQPYISRSFASYHPGGANFCLCDGSVTFIKDSIELQQKITDFGYMFEDETTPGYLVINGSKYVPGAYMNMATIDGGEVVQPQQ